MCMSLMILLAEMMLLGKPVHPRINKIGPLVHEGRRDYRMEMFHKRCITFTTPNLGSRPTDGHTRTDMVAQNRTWGAQVYLQNAHDPPWICGQWLTSGLLRTTGGGGPGPYGVFLRLSEVPTRQQLPNQVCCSYRGGLQLLLRVTFITTINMHATHRHTRLEEIWHYEHGA